MPFTRPSKYSLREIFNQLFNPDTNKLTVDTTLSEKIAGEDTVSDVLKVEIQSAPIQGTASRQVKTFPGRLIGLFISSASNTPTVKIWDSTAGSGAVLIDTFTPVAGQMYPFYGARFNNGCYITIGGTVSFTIFTA